MVSTGYDSPALKFFPDTAQGIVQQIMQSHSSDKQLKILDVCTGTGVVALTTASKLSKSMTIGIDLSEGMLSVAQQKASHEGLTNVHFHQLDMETLCFETLYRETDGSKNNHLEIDGFDVITCSYGLFFIEDMIGALKKLKTLLKPRGQIIISSFSEQAFEPYSSLFLKQYEKFGQTIPPLTWLRLSSKNSIRAVFIEAGFNDIEIEIKSLGYTLKAFEDWWSIVWNAGYRALYNQIPKDKQDAFRSDHQTDIEKTFQEQHAWMDTSYFMTIATLQPET